jgi:hypothetical protein
MTLVNYNISASPRTGQREDFSQPPGCAGNQNPFAVKRVTDPGNCIIASFAHAIYRLSRLDSSGS